MTYSPKTILYCRILLSVVVVAICLGACGAAWAGGPAVYAPMPGPIMLQRVVDVETADGTPSLNPENDTYYQLVSVRKHWPGRYLHDGVNWAEASQLAFSMKYKGRVGRLAIVDSRQINDFLRVKFPIEGEAWIGLRYWCHYKRFTWVNGDTHKLNQFQNWGSPWNVGGSDRFSSPPTPCNSNVQFWGVHYWRVQYGFNWNANGKQKRYPHFFVEYPPAAPVEEPAAETADKPAS